MKTNRIKPLAFSVAVALATVAAPAQAQDTTALERRLEAMEAEMEELRREIAETRVQAEHAGEQAAKAEEKAVAAESGSGLKIKPRGRFHLDMGFNDSDETELSDGFLNRRSRIGVAGSLNDDWGFQIEYDFGENGTSANDVRLTRKVGGGTFKIGQFKVPFGLNELTSSNNITFMERSSPSNVTADSRRLGIGYDSFSGPVGFQVMAYGRAIGDSLGGGDMPLGVAGRMVFNPVKTDTQLLHLGIAAAHENRRDADTVRFRDRPESRASSGTRLIDTGDITDVDSTLKFGAEFAYQAGPFSVESEYFRTKLNRDAGEEPTFDGWHIQAGYVLTGESRGYRGGVFRGISPSRSAGAWELAARYSRANLNDGGFVGGEQNNLTLGLNWYATSNIRFMANLIFVDVEDGVAAPEDDSPRILAMRAQYSF